MIVTGIFAAAAAPSMSARGCPPRLIILSGGAAAEIAAALSHETILHENLVLDGLLLIARAG